MELAAEYTCWLQPFNHAETGISRARDRMVVSVLFHSN
jgi:hypothetical protein